MIRSVGALVALAALVSMAAAEPVRAPAKRKPAATAKRKAAEPQPVAPPEAVGEAEHELTPAEIEAQMPAHINGPKLVDLGNNIVVDLPAGMVLFEKAEATAMLEKGGDHSENVNAVVLKVDADWAIVIQYDDVGYVTDKDADQLDPSQLFSQYEEGNKSQNERRKAMGIGELFLDGWSEMPKYDKAAHHLVWGLKAHTDTGQIVNYFRRILGRSGYMSVNLIDAPERLEASKLATAALVGGTKFKAGSAYEDHKSEDKSSGMGLRALVLGGTGLVALKVAKTGLIIKLLLIFKKGFIVVFAAIGGFFRWLFGKKNKDETFPPLSDNSPPSDDTTST